MVEYNKMNAFTYEGGEYCGGYCMFCCGGKAGFGAAMLYSVLCGVKLGCCSGG